MRKIYLIIEDEKNKFSKINDFLTDYINTQGASDLILNADNYTDAITIIRKETIDVILLDMSIPIRSVDSKHDYSQNTGMFSGLNILSELDRRKNNAKIILITAYSSWNDGEKVTSLKELDLTIKKGYDVQYIGYVYFDIVSQNWSNELKRLLEGIK